ncbi:hypothetical protein HM1_2579 [Heliomicrobium modesticaldum Ice1]|uniref:Uncharacterized protein n=1 Tax=Heliobacterium modesticaldum (strain ATCC 51547 / Ice1) TaxID=498761 RepID=B0TB05_HELMI|nr:hypothetical protein [Heliomicrobium modesticaldum]ABZ85116.1 hypothetical protein HM1_2579 [Heliomicrobium modesticaldum Ice1]
MNDLSEQLDENAVEAKENRKRRGRILATGFDRGAASGELSPSLPPYRYKKKTARSRKRYLILIGVALLLLLGGGTSAWLSGWPPLLSILSTERFSVLAPLPSRATVSEPPPFVDEGVTAAAPGEPHWGDGWVTEKTLEGLPFTATALVPLKGGRTVAADPQGMLYVINGEGEIERQFGPCAGGGTANITGLAVEPRGYIFVGTNERIEVWRGTGELVSYFSVGGSIASLALNDEGKLLVSDQNGKIKIISAARPGNSPFLSKYPE